MNSNKKLAILLFKCILVVLNEFKPKITEIANCPRVPFLFQLSSNFHFTTQIQFWAMWCCYVYTTLTIESRVLQIVENTIISMYCIGFECIHAKKVPKLQIVPMLLHTFRPETSFELCGAIMSTLPYPLSPKC